MSIKDDANILQLLDDSSNESSNESSKSSSKISTKLSTNESSSQESSTYISSSINSSDDDDINTEYEISLDQLNVNEINDKFCKIESDLIITKHNNQKRFLSLETDVTICKKNIGDMSRRIFDLEDENFNIKISNVDILQKLDEQRKLNDDLIKKIIEMKEEKPKSLHFISRRNDFI
jgi:hypothetical protein